MPSEKTAEYLLLFLLIVLASNSVTAWEANSSSDWKWSDTEGTFFSKQADGIRLGEKFSFETYDSGQTPDTRGWHYAGMTQDSSNYIEVTSSESVDGSKSLEIGNNADASPLLNLWFNNSKINPKKITWHAKVVDAGSYYHSRVRFLDKTGKQVFQPYFQEFSHDCSSQYISDRISGKCWGSYSNNQWYRLETILDYQNEEAKLKVAGITKTVGITSNLSTIGLSQDSDGTNQIVDRFDNITAYYYRGSALNRKKYPSKQSWSSLETNTSLNSGGINVTASSDTDDDGKYEDSMTYQLDGKTEEFDISQLRSGYRIKINFTLETESLSKTPVVNSFRANLRDNSAPKIDILNSKNVNTDKDTSPAVEVTDPDSDKMNITFYDASDDSQIGEVKNKGNGTYSVEWTGLSADQTYNWYAKVTDGKDTVKSNTAEFTTIDIDISWTDNSGNEDGFNIYNNASGDFKQVATTGENTASYTDYSKNLEFGKYTCYQVTSYNQYGESDPLEGCITP